MLRFGRMKTLQRFASTHTVFHNHFNQERHLVSRDIYPPRWLGEEEVRGVRGAQRHAGEAHTVVTVERDDDMVLSLVSGAVPHPTRIGSPGS